MATQTPTLEITTDTDTATIKAVYATAKTETTFKFSINVQPEDVAGLSGPFSRVKNIKALLSVSNAEISKEEIESFLDKKFAIERAKAALAVADDSLVLSYQEHVRKDGSKARVIRANDRVLSKADMVLMLAEQAKLIAELQSK